MASLWLALLLPGLCSLSEASSPSGTQQPTCQQPTQQTAVQANLLLQLWTVDARGEQQPAPLVASVPSVPSSTGLQRGRQRPQTRGEPPEDSGVDAEVDAAFALASSKPTATATAAAAAAAAGAAAGAAAAAPAPAPALATPIPTPTAVAAVTATATPAAAFLQEWLKMMCFFLVLVSGGAVRHHVLRVLKAARTLLPASAADPGRADSGNGRLPTPEADNRGSSADQEPGQVIEPVLQQAAPQAQATLLDLLPPLSEARASAPALLAEQRVAFSHTQVRAALAASQAWDGLTAAAAAGRAGAVLAVCMEPGPELALALLAIMARARCAPLNPAYTELEALHALQQLDAALLLARGAPGASAAASSLGLPVWELQGVGPDVHLGCLSSPLVERVPAVPAPGPPHMRMSSAVDVVLLLRTSGTTGKSKVVPITLGQHVQGSQLIGRCCELQDSDVCLNVLPLFHIGGISCNLMASLLASGSVICMGSFNPEDFVRRLPVEPKPTWYYASPSIHQACLSAAGRLGGLPALRLIRNAAAALPVELQQRLARQWHPAVILPTYGMTECMPIASPLLANSNASASAPAAAPAPAPLGSVGRLVGPSARIVAGELQLRGGLVMQGYVNTDAESGNGLDRERWFRTGDLCHIDSEGYLRVQGRCKEAINRGGETISPMDVENAVLSSPGILAALAFPLPDERLGEAVGLAMILDVPATAPDADLLAAVSAGIANLSPSSRPALTVLVDSVPKTSTGKVSRLSLRQQVLASPDLVADAVWAARASLGGMALLDLRGGGGGRVVRSLVADLVGQHGEETMQAQVQVQLQDSLGQVREASPVAALSQRICKDMCLLGMVGICLQHWRMFGYCLCPADPGAYMCWNSLPVFEYTLAFLFTGQWDLMAFFLTLGWQDGAAHAEGGGRDGFSRREVVLFCIPCTLSLAGVLGLTTQHWSTAGHPARWFICTYLISRTYVLLGPKLCASAVALSLLWLPLSALVLRVLALFMQGSSESLRTARFLVGLTGADQIGRTTHSKVYQGIVIYVLAYFWLPPLFRLLAKRGGTSRPAEVAWGLGLAGAFSALMCLRKLGIQWTSHDGYLMTVEVPDLDLPGLSLSFNTSLGQVSFPAGVPLTLVELLLLLMFLTYLPLTTVPDFVKDARLAVLLLMPLAMLEVVTCSMRRLLDWCPHVLWQVAVVMSFLGCYMGVVAPLLQMLALKALHTASSFPRLLLSLKQQPGWSFC